MLHSGAMRHAHFAAMADEERVILAEQVGVGRETVGQPPLELGVASVRRWFAEPGEDAAGVGVDDEGGDADRVQHDRVGGLRTDACTSSSSERRAAAPAARMRATSSP